MALWQTSAPWLFGSALLLLVAVLDARHRPRRERQRAAGSRWACVNFQASARLATLSMVLYAADYTVRRMDVRESLRAPSRPMAAAVLLVGPRCCCEPDFGAVIVIADRHGHPVLLRRERAPGSA
jgi:cell division protein FtsW